jgi:hypothetical protein
VRPFAAEEDYSGEAFGKPQTDYGVVGGDDDAGEDAVSEAANLVAFEESETGLLEEWGVSDGTDSGEERWTIGALERLRFVETA